MPDPDTDMVLGTVTIERVLTGDDLSVKVCAESSDGDRLDLVESLGMLRLAEAVLLEDAGEEVW